MIVRELHPRFYQVESNGRWWTAQKTAHGWHIQNEAGDRIKADGVLGLKIVAAIGRAMSGLDEFVAETSHNPGDAA